MFREDFLVFTLFQRDFNSENCSLANTIRVPTGDKIVNSKDASCVTYITFSDWFTIGPHKLE